MSQRTSAYFINVFHNFLAMLTQESAARFLFDSTLTAEAVEIQSRNPQVKRDVSKYIAGCKKPKAQTRSAFLWYLLSDMAVSEGFILHEYDFSWELNDRCPGLTFTLVSPSDFESGIGLHMLPDGNMYTTSYNKTQTAVRGRNFYESMRTGITQLVKQQADYTLGNQCDLLDMISVVKAAIVGKHNKTVSGRMLDLAIALDERGYKV